MAAMISTSEERHGIGCRRLRSTRTFNMYRAARILQYMSPEGIFGRRRYGNRDFNDRDNEMEGRRKQCELG
jgi:hypothetical protein